MGMEKKLKRGLHVISRDGIYYFNRRIPLDLLDKFSRQSKFYESLRTADLIEANRRAARRTSEIDEEFAQLRLRAIPTEVDDLSQE